MLNVSYMSDVEIKDEQLIQNTYKRLKPFMIYKIMYTLGVTKPRV